MFDDANIMLVEDDPELGELVAGRLRREGFHVDIVDRGDTAITRILAAPPELVVLDIMLPGADGFEVLRRVRPDYTGPILVLTARDDELDEIVGLELGADDYMTKPVRARALVARVRALLRRAPLAREPVTDAPLRVGSLVCDPARREVRLAGRLLTLTTTEFDLLRYLAERAGRVVPREDLYRDVSGTEYDGLDRSIDVHVSRLRQKLGDDPRQPQWLKTVRGVGYLLATP